MAESFVPDSITKAIIERWCGRQCYLNGKPAIISGRKNRFATVATLDGSQSFEWNWHTVNRVMYGKMEFST